MVAGGETAGIPFAAWMADRLMLPMAYIRKKPKGFGRNARIEGNIKEGQRVLLVEDLATDGGSKLSFVEGIRDAGAECAHCFVVFHYGTFPESVANLKAQGVDAACALHLVGRAGLCRGREAFTPPIRSRRSGPSSTTPCPGRWPTAARRIDPMQRGV